MFLGHEDPNGILRIMAGLRAARPGAGLDLLDLELDWTCKAAKDGAFAEIQ